jgi:hypothetical protein
MGTTSSSARSKVGARRRTWREPRVTLLLHSLTSATVSPYATIHGAVELADDPGGAFHQEMYGFYMGGATPPPEPGAHRLLVRVRPQRAYAPFPYSAE